MTGIEEAALVASVLGTGASVYGQHQQAQERRDIANKQLMRTAQDQDKTTALVQKEGQNYAPDARTAALEGQQATTLAQEQKDLGTAPTIIEGAGDAGNVSSDYLTAKADKAVSEGTRLTAIARELAKTRAPGQLMTTEGLRRANLTGELSSIWGSDRNSANAANLDAQSVEEPLYGSLGKIASAAGGAYLAGGGGVAPSIDGAGGMALQEGGYPVSLTGEQPYTPSVFGRPGLGQIRFRG